MCSPIKLISGHFLKSEPYNLWNLTLFSICAYFQFVFGSNFRNLRQLNTQHNHTANFPKKTIICCFFYWISKSTELILQIYFPNVSTLLWQKMRYIHTDTLTSLFKEIMDNFEWKIWIFRMPSTIVGKMNLLFCHIGRLSPSYSFALLLIFIETIFQSGMQIEGAIKLDRKFQCTFSSALSSIKSTQTQTPIRIRFICSFLEMVFHLTIYVTCSLYAIGFRLHG